jgi:hypothetical protein
LIDLVDVAISICSALELEQSITIAVKLVSFNSLHFTAPPHPHLSLLHLVTVDCTDHHMQSIMHSPYLCAKSYGPCTPPYWHKYYFLLSIFFALELSL